MAERIVSPGVFSREQDLSFIAPAAVEASTAFVGPTVTGPVSVPKVVTSYSQFKNIFGSTFKVSGEDKEYLTSVAVRNFFAQGGESALITRVLGTATAASCGDVAPLATSTNVSVTDLFDIDTLAEGADQNSGTATVGTENYLAAGTADNVRIEIADVDDETCTFTILVRRGDDNDNNKVVLETFANVTLDPTSNNYIRRAIGDKTYRRVGTDFVETGTYANRSNYIVVSGINSTVVSELANGYFDQAGAIRQDSTSTFDLDEFLPAETTTLGFTGGTGAGSSSPELFDAIASQTECQGVAVSAYTDIFNILGNKDAYNFDVIVAPGLIYNIQGAHATAINSMITLAEERGDCIAVVDLGRIDDTVAQVASLGKSLNSSFAATYFPWVKVRSESGQIVWVPASTLIPGVYAFTDSVAAPWFAPAGLVRGGIPGVLNVRKKLSRADRDTLYSKKVNPIASFPGQGYAVFGQKTLQTKASALDRVNVRRLLIELKAFLGNQGRNLIFEQNTIATRNRFLSAVNPYLESVVQRQGLYAYRVVMDDTNNTADVIDRNQLVGQIYIQPAKTAEFIVLDFVVEPTGATFGA